MISQAVPISSKPGFLASLNNVQEGVFVFVNKSNLALGGFTTTTSYFQLVRHSLLVQPAADEGGREKVSAACLGPLSGHKGWRPAGTGHWPCWGWMVQCSGQFSVMGGQLVLSVPGVAHRLGVRTVAVVPRVHRHHLQHTACRLLQRVEKLVGSAEYVAISER